MKMVLKENKAKLLTINIGHLAGNANFENEYN